MPEPIALADPAADYHALRDDIVAAAERVLASGRYVLGAEGEALERELAHFVGVPYAVGVNSGTDAIHLALVAAGVGPGDEVIVPAFTFFATAEAVVHAGATPVFADVDAHTFNLDPASLHAHIGPRTRAVIAVHLFGQVAALDTIAPLCEAHHLTLVEDCAQAIGAQRDGRHAGSVGAFGCFSFYPTKNLSAAGDAGLVTCRSAEHAEQLRMLRHHGSREPHVHSQVGCNSRLDEIQAAILRVKLPHLERLTCARERIASTYRERLAHTRVQLPFAMERGRHVWHQFTIQSERRDAIRRALADDMIASGLFYTTPLYRQPALAHLATSPLPVAERLASRVLSLPMHPFLSDQAIERVVAAVQRSA